jgi:hypothetical protein
VSGTKLLQVIKEHPNGKGLKMGDQIMFEDSKPYELHDPVNLGGTTYAYATMHEYFAVVPPPEKLEKYVSFRPITIEDLNGIEEKMTKKDLELMRKKMGEVLNNLIFSNFESKAAAESVFKLSYLSTFIKYS